MKGQPWKQHVATTCGEACDLDARATSEVMRCIEEMMATDGITDSVPVQVFVSVGAGKLGTGRSAVTIRVLPVGSSPT